MEINFDDQINLEFNFADLTINIKNDYSEVILSFTRFEHQFSSVSINIYVYVLYCIVYIEEDKIVNCIECPLCIIRVNLRFKLSCVTPMPC